MTAHLALSPAGHLYLASRADDAASMSLDPSLRAAFERGQAPGILALAAWRGAASLLAANIAFWRDFGRTFLATLARAPESDDVTAVPPERMPEALGAELTLAIPAMPGAEYATPAVFDALWEDLRAHAQPGHALCLHGHLHPPAVIPRYAGASSSGPACSAARRPSGAMSSACRMLNPSISGRCGR